MKEVLIREYEILISAPSDVYSFVETVKSAIAEYNNEQGAIDHIRFIQKNWREHSVPAYGKSAQVIINEQLTNNAEIVIAMFGAKFGEPTEKYSSGTLEEIETVHKSGGRVLTYFYTGALEVASIDPEQLKKVQEYKKTYQGLYGEFKTEDELKKRIYTDLIRLAYDLKNSVEKDLMLYSFQDDELHDELTYTQYDFLHSEAMENIIGKIKTLIAEINGIVIEKPVPITRDQTEIDALLGNFEAVQKTIKAAQSLAAAFPTEAIIFDDDFTTLVQAFVKANGLTISDDFFDIGNAAYSGNQLMGYSICGKDNEEKKAELLLKLQDKIHIYYHLLDFVKQYADKYYLTLVIKNESNIFADGITIKLYFEKGAVVNPADLSINARDIGDIVKDFPDLFVQKDNVDIEDMDYGIINYPTHIQHYNPITLTSSEPDLDYYKDYYRANNKEVYPILFNEKENQTVIKIELKTGLKQFTSRFLCAALILNKPIESVKYYMTSKSFGHEIKGELKYKAEEK